MPDLPLSASGRTAAEVARACASEGGRIAMAAFGARQDVRVKGRGNVVTETDLAAEHAVLAILREEYPEHAVLSEETAGGWNEARGTGHETRDMGGGEVVSRVSSFMSRG